MKNQWLFQMKNLIPLVLSICSIIWNLVVFIHGPVYVWLKWTGFFPMLPRGSHTSASTVHVFIFPNGIELGRLGSLFHFWVLSVFETKSQSKMWRLNILCFMNHKSSMTHLSCNFMALLAWKWATAIGHLQHHRQGKLILWLFFETWNLKEK